MQLFSVELPGLNGDDNSDKDGNKTTIIVISEW